MSSQASIDEHVFLMGRPPIQEFLGFIITTTVGGQNANHGLLMNEWRTANQHLTRLAQDEAGFADNPEVLPLSAEAESIVTQLKADPHFQRGFQQFPYEIGMVELDKLVVYQKSINLGYVNCVRSLLGGTPTYEKVVRVALGLDRNDPAVSVTQTAANSYVFSSSSNDFRFLMPRLLGPQDLADNFSSGPLSHVLGLAVGYSTNCISAIGVGNRLILSNGSHRAYTLRDMGLRHAPCVIMRLSTRDELELFNVPDLNQHPDRYLDSPRPPLLKDYFDPALRKIVQVPRKNRVVRLQFGLEQADMPAA